MSDNTVAVLGDVYSCACIKLTQPECRLFRNNNPLGNAAPKPWLKLYVVHTPSDSTATNQYAARRKARWGLSL